MKELKSLAEAYYLVAEDLRKQAMVFKQASEICFRCGDLNSEAASEAVANTSKPEAAK